jgi:hypothetical protein
MYVHIVRMYVYIYTVRTDVLVAILPDHGLPFLYKYVRIHIYIYLYTNKVRLRPNYTNLRTYPNHGHARVYVCMWYVRTHTHTHVCVCVWVGVCMYVTRTYVRVCVCVCVCACVCETWGLVTASCCTSSFFLSFFLFLEFLIENTFYIDLGTHICQLLRLFFSFLFL